MTGETQGHTLLASRSNFLLQPGRWLRQIKNYLNNLRDRWPNVARSVYVLDVPLKQWQKAPKEGCVCRITDAGELLDFARERVSEDRQFQSSADAYQAELRRRFARGDVCYAALQQGQVAGVIFTTATNYLIWEIHYTLPLPEKTIMFYDAYTLKRFRKQNLYRQVLQFGIQSSLKAGYSAAWICILDKNTLSFKVHNKIGVNHIRDRIVMRQKWGIRRHQVESLNIPVTGSGLIQE